MQQYLSFLETATAAETAQTIGQGDISALEACDAAIDRIGRLDAALNAIVVRDFERARTAAKALDNRRNKNKQLPLLGVPMTVKESHDVAGLPSTWGLPSASTEPADIDSVAVSRLKNAGAVILGKSNVSTALADWQANNPVYGRTLNPYDHSRSPGGSSGGAAAALACGMVPLELGSDIGGSIRIPAHLCGIFGHKPTFGILPTTGHDFPGTDSIEAELAVIGPMARSAGDLAIALDILAGPAGGSAYRLELPRRKRNDLRDFRVLVLDTHPVAATDGEIRTAIGKLADGLDDAGVAIARDIDGLPDLEAAHGQYTAMLMAITTRGVPGVTPMDVHKWMHLQDVQMQLTRQWSKIFEQVDVVITPAFGVAAFPHDDIPDWSGRTLMIDGAAEPYGKQLAWAGVATFPGLPATVAPVALTRFGLPIGVQIIGPTFADHTTIGFAALLEQAGLTSKTRPKM